VRRDGHAKRTNVAGNPTKKHRRRWILKSLKYDGWLRIWSNGEPDEDIMALLVS
jgi:hypothetical protein